MGGRVDEAPTYLRYTQLPHHILNQAARHGCDICPLAGSRAKAALASVGRLHPEVNGDIVGPLCLSLSRQAAHLLSGGSCLPGWGCNGCDAESHRWYEWSGQAEGEVEVEVGAGVGDKSAGAPEVGRRQEAISLHALRNVQAAQLVGWCSKPRAEKVMKFRKINSVVVDDFKVLIKAQFLVAEGKGHTEGYLRRSTFWGRGWRALLLQATKNRWNTRSWAMLPRNQTALGTHQLCSGSSASPVRDLIGWLRWQ